MAHPSAAGNGYTYTKKYLLHDTIILCMPL